MSRKLTVKERIEKYQLAAEDFYIDSYGNITFICEVVAKQLKKYPENSIQHLGAYMWAAAIGEIQVIFGDLATEKHTLLSNRQRGYFTSIRFCMETIADLEYLYLHPKELDRFMTDGDEIGREMNNLKKTCATDEELDESINKLLIKGKINSKVTERISQALPGCLRDYAMLCLYSHPSMEGFRLYHSKEGTLDLMFYNISFLTFKVLASYYRALLQLKLLNTEADELFDSIVTWILDCHRRIVNIQSNYAKKSYRKDRILRTAKIVKEWAHKSKIGDSSQK